MALLFCRNIMRIHAFHRLYQQRVEQSTRPFCARGSHVERCPFCRVAKVHCLCSVQPDIECSVACLLIMAGSEVLKPSNTGRLIADTIKETYVYQWHRTEPNRDMLALLANPDYQPVLIFPASYIEDSKRILAQDTLAHPVQGKKWLLIFIDGSWREARKIVRTSAYLQRLPVISIHPETLSRYMMRKSDNAQHLATAEVASLVLAQAKMNDAAQCLQLWFEAFRESYLLTKSQGSGDPQKPALARYSQYCQQQPK